MREMPRSHGPVKRPANAPPADPPLGISASLEHELFLLETLMEHVPDTIYFKDRDSRFTRINRHAAVRLGVTGPGEAVGRPAVAYFTEEHAAQALRDGQELIRTGQPLVNVEEKETLPDGEL